MLQLIPGGFLKEIEEDSSPVLGANLDGGGHNISNVGTGTFGILAISPTEQGVIRAVDGVLHGGSSHADLAELHQDVTVTASPSFAALLIPAGNVKIGGAPNTARYLNLERNGVILGRLGTGWSDLTLQAQNSADVRIVDDAGNGMIVKDGGKVAIGHVNPIDLLHLKHTSSHAKIVVESVAGYNAAFIVKNAAARFGYVQFWEGGNRIWMFGTLQSNGFTVSEADIPYSVWTNRFIIAPGGNVSLGAGAPATSAKLDIKGTTGALLIPRMTTAQRDALTALNGMLLYNSTLSKFQGYENNAWANLI